MARPIKDDSGEPLDENFLLRLTKTQKQEILPEYAKTANMTEADFARFRIFGEPPRQPLTSPQRQAQIEALGPLGFIRADIGHIRADINQILKDRWAFSFIKPERVEAVFAALDRAVASIEAVGDTILNNLEHDR